MNERQIFALENPCHFEHEQQDKRFERLETLPDGAALRTELRVFNYFGMMIWAAVGCVLDESRNEIPCAAVSAAARSELKKLLRDLIAGLGRGKLREITEGVEFGFLRELAPAELREMPAPPFAELLNVKRRQAHALQHPARGLESTLGGDYKQILTFGGTIYSTMLTAESAPDRATWHTSVSVLNEAGAPKGCYTILSTEFKQAMAMMLAMLEGVGVGATSTFKPRKGDTAHHLFRELSASERAKLPKPKLSEKVLPEFLRGFTRN